MHQLLNLGSPTWARTRDLRINGAALALIFYLNRSTRYQIIAWTILPEIRADTSSYVRLRGHR